MVDTLECYKVLDIAPGSSAKLVRAAYLELMQTWDPDRYVGNPLLQDRAKKKRAEIEEAYQAIRFFLPELQDPTGESEKPRRVTRDFKELSRQTVTETSKAVLGILVAIVFIIVFTVSYYLLVKGRSVETAPTVPSAPLE